MGQDAVSHLAQGARRADVEEFLRLLDYVPNGRSRYGEHTAHQFYFFNDKDFLSWEPVWALVMEVDGEVQVVSRTRIWAGHHDVCKHNELLRQLRKRFGGYFRSDEGKNRYFHVAAPPVTPSQSGCYQAYTRAKSNIDRLKRHLRLQPPIQRPRVLPAAGPLDIGQLYLQPEIFANNMAVPYVVSVLEDYFRSTFAALLTYSPRKRQILKKARFSADHLEAVSDGRMSIEAAAADSFSFQRVSAAGRHFAELDANIDLAGVLKRPFRRRRVSPYDSMEELIELRHKIVHRAEQMPSLTNETFGDMVLLAEVCLDRAYQHITSRYDWEAYDHFGFGFTRGL